MNEKYRSIHISGGYLWCWSIKLNYWTLNSCDLNHSVKPQIRNLCRVESDPWFALHCVPVNISIINTTLFSRGRLIRRRHNSTAVARWFRAPTQTLTTLFLLLPHSSNPRGASLAACCSPWNKALETPGPRPIHQIPFSSSLQCWGLTEAVVTAALNKPSLQSAHAEGTLWK